MHCATSQKFVGTWQLWYSHLWGCWPVRSSERPRCCPGCCAPPSVSEDCCLSSFRWTSWSKDLDRAKLGLLSFRGSESELEVMFSSYWKLKIQLRLNIFCFLIYYIFVYLNCLRLSSCSTWAWIFFSLQNAFFQFCCKLFFQLLVLCIQSILLRMAIYPYLHHSGVFLDDARHSQAGQGQAHLEVVISPAVPQNIL